MHGSSRVESVVCRKPVAALRTYAYIRVDTCARSIHGEFAHAGVYYSAGEREGGRKIDKDRGRGQKGMAVETEKGRRMKRAKRVNA